ncbi:hypothetical protein AVEN_89803-1 [Araneus ventricosus]|uniref:Uncharacterized protein n=1 Tax=Araneus ventricosus TaxID=182803 RepID=A0A4Y2U9G0_ARAVE|nr:hypothetical protein AVEN_89803-1 [Araneus ventricosus]
MTGGVVWKQEYSTFWGEERIFFICGAGMNRRKAISLLLRSKTSFHLTALSLPNVASDFIPRFPPFFDSSPEHHVQGFLLEMDILWDRPDILTRVEGDELEK